MKLDIINKIGILGIFLGLFATSWGQCDIPTADAGENQTICKGESVQLNGALIYSPRVELFNADFNNTSGNNNFTATTYTNAANWARGTSASVDGETISSGGSYFYYLNSESGNTGINTGNSYLTSPTFTSVGYTDLEISFRQYFRQDVPVHPVNQPDGNSLIYIEYSADNGATWTTTNITHSAVNDFRIGTASEFRTYKAKFPANIANSANTKIRFRYFHSKDWVWAIDDVKVTAIPNNFTVSWTGGSFISGQNTLYPQVNPSSTTTYTMTVKKTDGTCPTTSNVTVTVNSLEPGAINLPQDFCTGNSPASLQGTTPSGGGTYAYQWEVSEDCDGQWQPIAGATSANYSPGVLTEDKCLRRKVSNTCGTAYSTPIFMSSDLLVHYSFDENFEPTKNLIAGTGNSKFDPTFESYAVGEQIAYVDMYGNRKSFIEQFALSGSPIVEASNVNSYQGAKSLRVNRLNSASYMGFHRVSISNPVPFTQNEEVTYSAWVYSDIAGPRIDAQMRETSTGTYHTFNLATPHTGSGWEFLELNFTVPNTTTNFEGYFYIVSPNANSDTYWDNFQVEKKTHASRFVNGARNSTPILDHSGNNHHGTMTSTGKAHWIANGYEAGAYMFNGTSEIEFANPFSIGQQEWTVSAWININDLDDSGQQLVSGMNQGNYLNYMAVHSIPTRSKAPLMYLSNAGTGGDYFIYGNSNAIPENEWHLVTFVYKQQGNIRKIYLDNVDITNAGEQASITTTPSGFQSTLKIGTNFKGEMDDFRVYNKAMSQAEIDSLYWSYIPKVTVHQKPTITASVQGGGTATVCSGESIDIVASGAGTQGSYSWTQGLGTDASHTVSPENTTNYQVTGTDSNGCTNTANITVTVNPLPTVTNSSAIITDTDCQGSTGSIMGVTVNPSNSSVVWKDSNGNIIGSALNISGLANGTYYLIATDANGCSSTISSFVVEDKDQPTITIAGNTTACDGDHVTLTASGADSYTWNDAENSTTASITVIVTEDMNFTVTGIQDGCQGSESISIQHFDNPNITVDFGNTTSICKGSSITLTASGAGANGIYEWENEGEGASFTVSPEVATEYLVIGTDENGCENITSITVLVNELPNYEIGENEGQTSYEVCIGLEANMTLPNVNPAYTYTWFFNGTEVNQGDNYIISETVFNDNGTFDIVIANNEGCEIETIVNLTIKACDLIVVETFSPNGDNSNDYFTIENLEGYPNTQVYIYNRWGEKVFGSEDYQNDWAGTSQSKLQIGEDELPEGTYYYILVIGGDENAPSYGKKQTGFVYIKR